MSQALELLQTQPAEQLHHNLEHIAQSRQRDFVAEALRQEGRSLCQTVEFLYEKQENYNPGKAREIADFVGGFDGIEGLEPEYAGELDFRKVNEARDRWNKATSITKKYDDKLTIYSLFSMPFTFLTIGAVALRYVDNPDDLSAVTAGAMVGSLLLFAATYITGSIYGVHRKNKLMGNQKPTEAYNSLHFNASKADEYVQLYKLLEEKGFEARR